MATETLAGNTEVIEWRRGVDRKAYLSAQKQAEEAMARLRSALENPARIRQVERRSHDAMMAVSALWACSARLLE